MYDFACTRHPQVYIQSEAGMVNTGMVVSIYEDGKHLVRLPMVLHVQLGFILHSNRQSMEVRHRALSPKYT